MIHCATLHDQMSRQWLLPCLLPMFCWWNGCKKIINLLIFRAVSSKAIYMMLLFEVLFDYFKNILELTIENRVKKYTWTYVGTDQGFPGHSSGKPNKPNFLMYPPPGDLLCLISLWHCQHFIFTFLLHMYDKSPPSPPPY